MTDEDLTVKDYYAALNDAVKLLSEQQSKAMLWGPGVALALSAAASGGLILSFFGTIVLSVSWSLFAAAVACHVWSQHLHQRANIFLMAYARFPNEAFEAISGTLTWASRLNIASLVAFTVGLASTILALILK